MNPANPQRLGTGGGGQGRGGNPAAPVNSPRGGGQRHGGNPVASVNSQSSGNGGGGQGHGGNPVAPVNWPGGGGQGHGGTLWLLLTPHQLHQYPLGSPQGCASAVSGVQGEAEGTGSWVHSVDLCVL